MTKNRFFAWLPVIILATVTVLIYFTNLSGQFWLSGWDNLHPEFNYRVNLERALFSSWQEYQGLGLPAGHGHATELIREIFLWGLSGFVVPESIRKVYLALTLFIGATGTYVLIRDAILGELEERKRNILAFFGGLFYLLHPATVQLFYLPYEAFMAQFAFLPWMVWSLIMFCRRPTRGTLFWLGIANFIGSTQFYIPTLFLGYLLVVLVLVHGTRFKVAVLAVLTVVLVNFYWLLPFGYYTATNLHSQTEAYLNLRYSRDVYLKNVKFGNFSDVALLSGYLLDYTDVGPHGTYGYLMEPWREYLRSWPVMAVGFLLFAVVLVGIGVSLRRRERWGLVALFVIFFALLAVDVFPASLFSELLRRVNLFDQVFRNPYTKFANTLLLLYTIFFAWGLVALEAFLRGKWRWVFGAGVIFCLTVLSGPTWQGNFVYPALKIKIPQSYFALFNFFKDKGGQRIANFPQFANDGWENYDWGYRGSGFLWYGIEGPILDRAFDVWSRQNENYYWEVQYAIFSKNLPLLESVLDKYAVRWLVVDETIINPASPRAVFLDEFENLLRGSHRARLAAKFGSIKVYQFQSGRPESNFVAVADNMAKVSPVYKWNNLDTAFSQLGDYQEGLEITYPYRSLFTGRSQSELEFNPEQLLKASSGQELEVDPTMEASLREAKNCDSFSHGYVANTIVAGPWIQMTAREGTNCVSLPMPNLRHSQGYLVAVRSQNISGRPLLFWLENFDSRRVDQAVYLPKGQAEATSYFVIPPMAPDGLGYGLHFDNVAMATERTINNLGTITIAPLDFWRLAGERSGQPALPQRYVETFSVTHPNTAFYRVDLGAGSLSKANTLMLFQSFEPGWLAFGVDSAGRINRLTQHKLVNNWANGWELFGNERIVYLFFWPQVLEFVGLGLLTSALVGLIIRKIKSKPR